MIFDTDVIIWMMKGNEKAAEIINNTDDRYISIVTYMELLQGANNKKHHKDIRDFFKEYEFKIIDLSEEVGHRSSVYMEEYSLSHGLTVIDSLIAATATEKNMQICTANYRHFQFINELSIKKMKV